MSRELKFCQAVHEALDLCLARDPAVYLIGLGVPDPKGVFGTTLGLAEKYGPERVLDMPCAENGMTGVVIGSALAGMRPVMLHQRLDFALLAVEQLVNQAAKWHYMFGGKLSVPLVVRLIVGERRLTTCGRTGRRLDADHVGAEVGEQLGSILARSAREIEHTHAVERRGACGGQKAGHIGLLPFVGDSSAGRSGRTAEMGVRNG